MSLFDTGSARKPASPLGRYIFYAIGEIFLVVIGILIALQINNWNEWRKDRVRERKVLEEIHTSLESNLETMRTYLSRRENYRKSSQIIISTIENRRPNHDSLNLHFQFARIPNTILSLTTSGYENAKNLGFDIIISDKLRKSIIELFEVKYNGLYEQLAYFATFQPDRARYIDELFYYSINEFDPGDPIPTPIIPFDYQGLLQDRYLIAMLKSIMIQRDIMASNVSYCITETESVLQLIREELGE